MSDSGQQKRSDLTPIVTRHADRKSESDNPSSVDGIEVARTLAEAGLPVFVAPPNTAYLSGDKSKSEFQFPTGWPNTGPDPDLLDRWEPGWAVCLVAGHGLDAVDVDPAHGGDADEQLALLMGCGATVLGIAETPSGGAHIYVMSTGIGSTANTKIGVDYRGRHDDGTGGGFLYLPGTLRPKHDGAGYSWRSVPDPALLNQLSRDAEHRAITDYLATLGVGVTPVRTEGASAVPGEAVDLASLPPWLRDLLTDFGPVFTLADGSTSSDRSARFHHLVGACHRADLSQGQVVALLTTWCQEVG